jgi:uncharacterized C2H2 Zn-finger protein
MEVVLRNVEMSLKQYGTVILNILIVLIYNCSVAHKMSVPALSDGATLFGQAGFYTEKESPGIWPLAMPLLGHATQNWPISSQLTNTAFSGRTQVANIKSQKTGSSQFPCPKCHKVYTWKANLNRHLRLECGKKPHLKCPYCTYITNRKTSVQEHIRRRHKDLPNIV